MMRGPVYRIVTDPALAASCPAVTQQAWLDAKAARGQPIEGERLVRLEPLARAARDALPAMRATGALWLGPEWCTRGGTIPADRRSTDQHTAAARYNRLAAIMGRKAEQESRT
jgi:hypothetical protein